MAYSNPLLKLWKSVAYYFHLIVSLVNLPSLIYDYLFSRVLTRQTYQFMLRNNIKPEMEKVKSILDIGVGTGFALKSIIEELGDAKVVGIDINESYLKKAAELFKNQRNVEIRYQNVYELENSPERFDLILFSSSLMIMPDRVKALEIAKKLLNKNGKIICLLTLYSAKKRRFALMEKVKPYLKYYTTVDFGQLIYEADFMSLLKETNLAVTKKDRVYHKLNPLFYIFRFFCVESRIEG